MLFRSEFLTLNDSFQSENPDFDYESYPAFDLAEMSIADDCFAEFRSEKQKIPHLSQALQLPQLLDASNEAAR